MVKVRVVAKGEELWIKENILYDPDTGWLWLTKADSSTDGFADRLHTKGYRCVSRVFSGRYVLYLSHRLAWFLHYGVWPTDQIDHINNIRDDNRILNLREATNFENQGNRKIQKGGTSKYKGVCWDREKSKWVAYIQVNYKMIKLGRYTTEEEAALAYNKAALEYFGEYAKINIIEPLDTGITNTYINSSSGELTC